MRRIHDPLRVERLPLTRARVHLGAVVRQVCREKALFILEKDGIPVAGLIDIGAFEDFLELRDPKVAAAIRRSQADYVAGRSRSARALQRKLRAERCARGPRRRASA